MHRECTRTCVHLWHFFCQWGSWKEKFLGHCISVRFISMEDDKKSILIQHGSMLCRSNFSRSRVLHLVPETANSSFLTFLFPPRLPPRLQAECVWLQCTQRSAAWHAVCVQTVLQVSGWLSSTGRNEADFSPGNLSLTSSSPLLFPTSQHFLSPISSRTILCLTGQSILQFHQGKQDWVMRRSWTRKTTSLKWEI